MPASSIALQPLLPKLAGSWERGKTHPDGALQQRTLEGEQLVGGRQGSTAGRGWRKRGRVLIEAPCEPRRRHSPTSREMHLCVCTGAGSDLPWRMAVYQGLRLQAYLREAGLGAAGAVLFCFKCFQF